MIFSGETYDCRACGETFAIYYTAMAKFCPCCGATDVTLTVD